MKLPDIIILAGGKATRLKELTKYNSKSMIRFNNKPFIKYQLDLLEKKNLKE